MYSVALLSGLSQSFLAAVDIRGRRERSVRRILRRRQQFVSTHARSRLLDAQSHRSRGYGAGFLERSRSRRPPVRKDRQSVEVVRSECEYCMSI